MLNLFETWLINKTKNKPKSFWAKLGVGVLLFLLAVVVFLKYNYFKNKVETLKTKNILSEDDKKDAVLQEQLKSIKQQKSSLIKEVIRADSNINKVDGNIKKTKQTAKTDLELIDNIDSWDDVDKKIK